MSISPAIFTPDDNGDQFLNGRFFRSSGLLWKINHDILHPLGLALGVGTAGADGSDDSVAALFRIFVSDDGPAILAAEGLGVRTASSLDLIIAWSELDASRPAYLTEIVERIEVLARYVPPGSHPRKEWWDTLRRRR